MKINEYFSGFCPTLDEETSITVIYEVIERAGKTPKLIQVGADCEYASFGNCPIMLDCPIRAKAPEVIGSD